MKNSRDASEISEPIPFNQPFVAGKELFYIAQAVTFGNLAGDGYFTKKCCGLLEQRFGVERVLLTPSCTAALEMCAMICELGPGDEVIMPSYTFVTTASSFVRVGAVPIFVDIRPDTLNIDENLVEAAISKRTKAICVVHYAGVACEMDAIRKIADAYGLWLIEDAAQAVNSCYGRESLGAIGDLGCYSFHETKNFICGEGGALCINDPNLVERAEIIRDKGTNRQQFYRGCVDKYTWVALGSSYVPSEICSAFLYAQLEELDAISLRRREAYEFYLENLKDLEEEDLCRLPVIPEKCKTNHHLFYLITENSRKRDSVLEELQSDGVNAVFHYVPLHSSPMGRKFCAAVDLPVTDDLSSRLLRVPLFHEITIEQQTRVLESVRRSL